MIEYLGHKFEKIACYKHPMIYSRQCIKCGLLATTTEYGKFVDHVVEYWHNGKMLSFRKIQLTCNEVQIKKLLE